MCMQVKPASCIAKFDGNFGSISGHMSIAAGCEATITDSQFLNGFGSRDAGAIMNDVTLRIQWQNELMNQGYAETYLKTIHNQISALLNYAVKYYGLRENPCHKSGSMGRKHAKEMQF